MKKQIAEIILADEREIGGNLFFYWIDKSVKLAQSIRKDLEKMGIAVCETLNFYYFIVP